MSKSTKIDFKVVMLGSQSVGKTSLVQRFLTGKFTDDVVATVGAAFGAKKVMVKAGGSARIGIWDTAGSERYESMTRIYYRNAKAAIICFDLTNEATFTKVRYWVDELLANEKNCFLYVVGTKEDLVKENPGSRAVDVTTIKNFVSNISAQYYETSAKSNLNVDDLFEKITDDYIQRSKILAPPSLTDEKTTVELKADSPKADAGACAC
eukprot:TRINITY_DN8386_c0_g1_i1.p1 TRINITY_DN8386_c0_g1~~TRINITY_DN8386_c0_g1_i1.p1  ORF type:complete len:209 (-),score=16.16 TRINITY_DN8386_c0_g1_i1:102-728(-)